jgi:hypothetical protein
MQVKLAAEDAILIETVPLLLFISTLERQGYDGGCRAVDKTGA